MLIAQISDTHILARSSGEAAGASRADDLRRCVADINRQKVDAVVHTGDNTHNGTAEEYAHLREILSGLDAPLFTIPGNRDRREALRAAFADLPYLPKDGEHVQYVVDGYPVRLVALDSVAPGQRKGDFCARRLAWLEETLAHGPDRPTILFIHHPPFDIAGHYVGGYLNPGEAADLAATVARHPQVRRLLCGHVHCLHRDAWGGTIATTMPSVAVDLRMAGGAAPDPAPMYLLHAVSDAGEVDSRTRTVPGRADIDLPVGD